MIIPLIFPITPNVTTAAPIFIATIRARELDLLWPAWQERARPTCLLLSISAHVPATSTSRTLLPILSMLNTCTLSPPTISTLFRMTSTCSTVVFRVTSTNCFWLDAETDVAAVATHDSHACVHWRSGKRWLQPSCLLLLLLLLLLLRCRFSC